MDQPAPGDDPGLTEAQFQAQLARYPRVRSGDYVHSPPRQGAGGASEGGRFEGSEGAGFWDNMSQLVHFHLAATPHQAPAVLAAHRHNHNKFLTSLSLDQLEALAKVLNKEQ